MKCKQIIFTRHGEKIENGKELDIHLSTNGYIRANELSNYLKQLPINTPDILISMKQTKANSSNRPYETLHPLSVSLNLPIINDYVSDKIDKVVDQIKEYKDKTVIVCWEHQYLVDIIKKFNVDVKNWGLDPFTNKDDGDCYNAIWVLTSLNKTLLFQIFKSFDVNNGVIHYNTNNPVLSKIF